MGLGEQGELARNGCPQHKESARTLLGFKRRLEKYQCLIREMEREMVITGALHLASQRAWGGHHFSNGASQMALVVKNLPANTEVQFLH